MGQKITVLAKLSEIVVDHTQYKPYTPHLTFDNVYVALTLPSEMVTRDGDKIIVEAKGFATILLEAGAPVDMAHAAYIKSELKKSKGG